MYPSGNKNHGFILLEIVLSLFLLCLIAYGLVLLLALRGVLIKSDGFQLQATRLVSNGSNYWCDVHGQVDPEIIKSLMNEAYATLPAGKMQFIPVTNGKGLVKIIWLDKKYREMEWEISDC